MPSSSHTVPVLSVLVEEQGFIEGLEHVEFGVAHLVRGREVMIMMVLVSVERVGARKVVARAPWAHRREHVG
jgi:hypothetical protein